MADESGLVGRLLQPLERPKASLRTSDKLDDGYLAAAREWLSEPLIRDQSNGLPMNVVLPAIVHSDTYRRRWKIGPWDKPFVFTKGAQTLRVKPTPASPGAVFAPVLRGLAFSRSWANGPLARLGRSWTAVKKDPGAVPPQRLVELTRAFRKAVRFSTPPLGFWASPLFQHWLLFSRLRSEHEDGPLDDQLSIRGVAAISWRLADKDWQPTQRILIS